MKPVLLRRLGRARPEPDLAIISHYQEAITSITSFCCRLDSYKPQPQLTASFPSPLPDSTNLSRQLRPGTGPLSLGLDCSRLRTSPPLLNPSSFHPPEYITSSKWELALLRRLPTLRRR